MTKNAASVSPRTDVSWKRLLSARPVRNASAAVEDRPDAVRITVQARRPWFLVPPLSWFLRPRLERTVALDALGSHVWGLCDGENTIEMVVETFAAQFGLTFHEARVSVTQYLEMLMRRGAVAVAVPEGKAA